MPQNRPCVMSSIFTSFAPARISKPSSLWQTLQRNRMRWNQWGNTTGRTPLASERRFSTTSPYSARAGCAATSNVAATSARTRSSSALRIGLARAQGGVRSVVAAVALRQRERHRAVAQPALLALQDLLHRELVGPRLRDEELLVAVGTVEPQR